MAADAKSNPFDTLLSPFANFLRTWDYQPVTRWLDHFITINWNAHDAGVEKHVLSEVGSYGLQLSRILDAVNLLLSDLDLAGLTPEQQGIVVNLRELARSSDRAVDEYRGRANTSSTATGPPRPLPRVSS
jgi:hypothetical protein